MCDPQVRDPVIPLLLAAHDERHGALIGLVPVKSSSR